MAHRLTATIAFWSSSIIDNRCSHCSLAERQQGRARDRFAGRATDSPDARQIRRTRGRFAGRSPDSTPKQNYRWLLAFNVLPFVLFAGLPVSPLPLATGPAPFW